jgi:hypothetical protein
LAEEQGVGAMLTLMEEDDILQRIRTGCGKEFEQASRGGKNHV